MAEKPRTARGESPRRRGDRAISEVLSYALIFAMIVSAIGIVTVGGLGSLQDARTNEQAANAERAYDVLADNMADVHGEGVPSRATEISLGESELFFGDNVTMEVEVDDAGTPVTHTFDDIRPIVFRIRGDTKLVYEAGAVIRSQRQGGIVLRGPPLAMDPQNVHIPIVRTTAPSARSVGSTNVLVRGQSINRTVLESATDPQYTIEEISITSPRAEIWGAYFEDREYCHGASVTGNTATCVVLGSPFDSPSRFYLTLQQIEVSLVR